MNAQAWPVYTVLVALGLTGCLTRTLVGSLPGDAGADAQTDADAAVDPLTELQEGMIGRFCGFSTWDPQNDLPQAKTEIEIEFGPSEYRVHCGCGRPFAGEPTPDDFTGRYVVTELTLDEHGWGRAEDPLGGGLTSRVVLQQIRLEGDHLSMVRRLGDGLGLGLTTLELERCDDESDN